MRFKLTQLAWCAKTTYLAHCWCARYKNLARVWCAKSLPNFNL